MPFCQSTYLLLQLTLILEIIAAMLHTELSNVAYWVLNRDFILVHVSYVALFPVVDIYKLISYPMF